MSGHHPPQGGAVEGAGEAWLPFLTCQPAAPTSAPVGQAQHSQVVFACHHQVRPLGQSRAQQQEGEAAVLQQPTRLRGGERQGDGFQTVVAGNVPDPQLLEEEYQSHHT